MYFYNIVPYVFSWNKFYILFCLFLMGRYFVGYIRVLLGNEFFWHSERSLQNHVEYSHADLQVPYDQDLRNQDFYRDDQYESRKEFFHISIHKKIDVLTLKLTYLFGFSEQIFRSPNFFQLTIPSTNLFFLLYSKIFVQLCLLSKKPFQMDNISFAGRTQC